MGRKRRHSMPRWITDIRSGASHRWRTTWRLGGVRRRRDDRARSPDAHEVQLPHEPGAPVRTWMSGSAVVQFDAARPAAAVATHDDDHVIARGRDTCALRGCPRAASSRSRDPCARAPRRRLPSVQGVDDLGHKFHVARLHLWGPVSRRK
jgi:hypothetical protein